MGTAAGLDDLRRWKVWVGLVLGVATWPVWGGFQWALSARYRLVVQRARGCKFTLVTDGIEVRKDGGPAQFVSWRELAEARWLEHLEAAPGFDVEHYALTIPRGRLALSEEGGDVAGIREQLAARGMELRYRRGGRSGRGHGVFLLIWTLAVAAAIVVWGVSGGWR